MRWTGPAWSGLLRLRLSREFCPASLTAWPYRFGLAHRSEGAGLADSFQSISRESDPGSVLHYLPTSRLSHREASGVLLPKYVRAGLMRERRAGTKSPQLTWSAGAETNHSFSALADCLQIVKIPTPLIRPVLRAASLLLYLESVRYAVLHK